MTTAILPYLIETNQIPVYTDREAPTGTRNRRRAVCQDCGAKLDPGTGYGWSVSPDEPWARGRTWYRCDACHKVAIYWAENAGLIAAQMGLVRDWLQEHMLPREANETLCGLNRILERTGEYALDLAEYMVANLGALEDAPTKHAVLALARQVSSFLCAGPVE